MFQAEDHLVLCQRSNPQTFWVEVTHVPGLQGIVGADLDLELQDGIWKTLKEELVHGHVEGWDDFLQIGKSEDNPSSHAVINYSL